MKNLQDYDLCHTSGNGAEVWTHRLHIGVERAANLVIACTLADLLSETVYLLPASSEPGTHNPDAQVGTELWEFKTNYAATGTSIDTAIREAYKQAHNVLLHLTVPMPVLNLENAIFNRVRKCSSLLKLSILIEQQLFSFEKAAVLNQRFRGIIKGKGSPT